MIYFYHNQKDKIEKFKLKISKYKDYIKYKSNYVCFEITINKQDQLLNILDIIYNFCDKKHPNISITNEILYYLFGEKNSKFTKFVSLYKMLQDNILLIIIIIKRFNIKIPKYIWFNIIKLIISSPMSSN